MDGTVDTLFGIQVLLNANKNAFQKYNLIMQITATQQQYTLGFQQQLFFFQFFIVGDRKIKIQFLNLWYRTASTI